jgi:hypothetical protein
MINFTGSRKKIIGAIDNEAVKIVYYVGPYEHPKFKANIYRDNEGKEFRSKCGEKVDGITVYELEYDEALDRITLVERSVLPLTGV